MMLFTGEAGPAPVGSRKASRYDCKISYNFADRNIRSTEILTYFTVPDQVFVGLLTHER